MSDPMGPREEERAREALREQADAARSLDPTWIEQYQDEARLAAQQDQPVAPPERLFSRKVLFGWAFAALVFVFIIRIVVPTVFETVKATIVSRMEPPTSNTAAPVIAPIPPLPAIPAPPAVPAVKTIIPPQGIGAAERPEIPERPEARERPAPKERPENSAKSGSAVPSPAKK